MTIKASLVLSLCAGLSLAGCSGQPSRISPPAINTAAGSQAVQQYDANGNGAIDGAELNQAPALKLALPRIDVNHDGKITAEEIDRRIGEWRNSRVGRTSCAVKVHRNGQPLANASVTLTPEAFLGKDLAPSHGTTDAQGMAIMRASNGPGAPVGFYRVEVSKIVDGKETIPARFNEKSELGLELATDVFDSAMPFFDLRGR